VSGSPGGGAGGGGQPPNPTPAGGAGVDDADVEIQSIGTPEERSVPKEQYAAEIAKQVISIFAGSLVGAFIIIAMLIWLAWDCPEAFLTKILPTLGNILEILKVIGALFSPLLAFILGYYFSLSTRTTSSDKKR
jgi:hypothetical protein